MNEMVGEGVRDAESEIYIDGYICVCFMCVCV